MEGAFCFSPEKSKKKVENENKRKKKKTQSESYSHPYCIFSFMEEFKINWRISERARIKESKDESKKLHR